VAAPDRLTLAGFALTVVFGGANAIAVRVSYAELPPLWAAGTRFLAAAFLLLALGLALRLPLPRGRALAGAALFGALTFGGGYSRVYLGLVDLPAGLVMVLMALVPLLTVFTAAAHGVEPLRARGVAGALLAALGVAAVAWRGLGAAAPLLPLLAVLGGAACWAEASVLVKRFPKVHPVSASGVGMVIGAAMLLAASALVGEPRVIPDLRATWAAWLYLVLVGGVGLFALTLWVLARWTASGLSYQFVLLPFVTLPLAAVLAGEPLTPVLALGACLVLAGVYVGALARGRPAEPAQPAGPEAPDPAAAAPGPGGNYLSGR
jgi:drug/metabolite transporter (DMT)-like permease